MVKTTNVWKSEFYKNDDVNCGAMATAIEACTSDQIVVHSQTKHNGRMWGCMTPDEFLKLIETNCGLYEVITQFPHKVYFDVDKKGIADPGFLDMMKEAILQYFPNAQMAISGSIKETKTSYHIVLQNYIIRDEAERDAMKHLVKYMNEKHDESFDWKVYTKNRNMKIINQSKDDGRVQEIVENDDFKSHCITCFIDPLNALPFVELVEEVQDEIKVNKSKHTFDLGELPKLTLNTPTNFDVVDATPMDILQALPLNETFNHSYTHLVARYCYYNALSFETFLAWINQKHRILTPELVSKWKIHWGKMDKFPNVSKEKMMSILKFYYPHITKDIHYRLFVETFNLPTEKIEKIETMNQMCFTNPNKKFFLYNVGMGGGKTAQTISYLKHKQNFCWIAPNRALATNTHKRFETEDIEVCHYESIKTKDKKAGKMKDEQKLICCLNSIHYITGVKYDILIIDEIETLIDKFIGDFLEQGSSQLKKQIWLNFVALFKNAKQVLLLDAFITTKTIKLIQNIEKTLETTIIFERINEPQTRTIKYMDDDKSMLQDIINKLNEGSKLFIFYPYKNSSSKVKSMEEIFNLLTYATNKKGIFYNADVDDKVKGGLKDVNESWKDKDFVLTNNIITCGVNYDIMDFDYKYIFIANFNTPRDIIQVSYRARHISSGIIKLCYMGKMNQNNTWLNDCEKMGCPIYKKMFNEILVEKKAPLKRAFQLFCVKAHYKQTTDDFKINETVERELTNMLNNQNVGMSYQSIDDIDFGIAEYIEEQCFAQQATMSMKYALNKYYFKKSFVGDVDEDMLAKIWNEKFLFFFKRLSVILKDDTHLFNQIAVHNKFDKLFPSDIKKTKLTDEIKQRIFKEFSFKFITSSSAATKTCKEIYNTYFGKHIITTLYDALDKKNIIYSVDEDIFGYYEFAKANLVLDCATAMTYNKTHEIDCESLEI